MYEETIRQIIPIKRASEGLINSLLDAGLIYIGEDNQLHVVDEEYRLRNGAKNV